MMPGVDTVKAWAEVYRAGGWPLCRLGLNVRKSSDLGRIAKLREEMKPALAAEPTGAAKYADAGYWIPFNVARAGSLGLHRSRPLRILDIGCGPGYFLATCRAAGHDYAGVDIPASFMTPAEQRVYGELLPALSVANFVTPLLVERFKPLDVPAGGFDLITAFWVCFNRHRQQDEWGAAEWQFFIEDARSHLRPGGVVHLELNSHPERYGPLVWYDSPTLDLFRTVGTVSRNCFRFKDA